MVEQADVIRSRLLRSAFACAHATLDSYSDESVVGFYVNAGMALEHASTFVRAMDALLSEDGHFAWGDWSDLAQSLVAEEIDAIRVRVESALTKARTVLDELLPAQVQTLRAAAAQTWLDDPYEDYESDAVLLECPVCGSTGIGSGDIVDEGDADFDVDGGEVSVHWAPDFYTVVSAFECGVCRLRLRGEECRVAGLPTKVPNERATLDDVYVDDDDPRDH